MNLTRKKHYMIILLFTFFICIFAPSIEVKASNSGDDYIYSFWEDALHSTPAYEFYYTIDGAELLNEGDEALTGLSDIHIGEEKIYIVDNDTSRIIITDLDWNRLAVIDDLKNPSSVYVHEDKIYVADTENNRIAIFDDNDYSLIKELGTPDTVAFDENTIYYPERIVVDKTGRIYVTARNIYEGILELTYDGDFVRFTGVNPVEFNFIEYFWKSIATEEQRSKMKLYLPTEFTGLDVDSKGFLYTTTFSANVDPIKKINLKGEDVLINNGMHPIQGDLDFIEEGTYNSGKSTFSSIAINEYGIYAALDTNRNRIFTYNAEGDLLYIFGGKGDKKSYFQIPTDISWMGENIVVVDKGLQNISVFKPTEFGTNINKANELYFNGYIDESMEYWQKVKEMNTNYELAYVGIGKILYRQGEYKEAVEHFKLGNNRHYYSKAFDKYRTEFLRDNFVWISIGTVGLLVGFLWLLSKGEEK